MSEEIKDIKESISFLAETQKILSENMLLQQQQFGEFRQALNFSLQESERRFEVSRQESERRFEVSRQESERRFNASQERLEAILLNQQRQIQLSEERINRMNERFAEEKAESDLRFNVLLQELRHSHRRIDQIEQSP